MIFDTTAFTGSWPFRKLGKTSIAQMLEDHAKNGITGGVVSKLESIFYNDPMEGDEELAANLPPGYKLAITHNPLLPFALKEIRDNVLGAVAVRIFPSYHGYGLRDEAVKEFCRAAAASNLVVYVVARMDDVRLEYMFRQNVPPIDDVAALVQAVPECKFVLSGLVLGGLRSKGMEISRLKNLYVDTSYANAPPFVFDGIGDDVPIERILFATHYPILSFEGNIIALKHSSLSEAEKRGVAHDNAVGLFGLGGK